MTIRPLKAELHAHTSDDPEDVIPYSSEELLDEAARQGFEVLAITNHNRQSHTRRLEDYARKRGVLLIKGKELTYDGQHILLLNFDDGDAIRTPEDIAARKGTQNLVVAAHPYFPLAHSSGRLLEENPGLFDAVEHAFLYIKRLNFNKKAVRTARRLGLPVIGTSDAHVIEQVGHTYITVHSEKTPEAVIAAIKEGRFDLVTKPLSFSLFIGIIFKMKWGSLVRWFKGVM